NVSFSRTGCHDVWPARRDSTTPCTETARAMEPAGVCATLIVGERNPTSTPRAMTRWTSLASEGMLRDIILIAPSSDSHRSPQLLVPVPEIPSGGGLWFADRPASTAISSDLRPVGSPYSVRHARQRSPRVSVATFSPLGRRGNARLENSATLRG